MSEKFLGWIAIVVIVGLATLVYKSIALTEKQLVAIIILLLASSIVSRGFALRAARLTVLKRRRLYKELWRRRDRGDLTLSKEEEDMIVLLGRIKGGKFTAVVSGGLTIAALLYKATAIALLLALGGMFLAIKLHLIARGLDQSLTADCDREPPDLEIPQTPSDRYIVEIDVQKVHDFIRPRNALPFWDLAETEQWLARCGFKSASKGKWEASRNALCYLDSDEVISIEPAEG